MKKLSIKLLLIFAILQIFLIFFSNSYASQQNWQYYFKKGQIQFKYEMYEYALFNLTKALELNKNLYESANYLAYIFLKKNKKSKAIKYFVKSLKINDNQPDIHCKLGEVYEYLARIDLAFEHFKRASSLDANHIKSNLNLFRFYYKQNKITLANKHFDISYKSGTKLSNELYFTAKLEHTSKNYSLAIKLYKDAIDKNPALIEAYLNLFQIYRAQRKFTEAIEILKKLIFYKPDHEKALIALGHLHFNNKLPGKRKYHIDKALKYLYLALEINPRNYDTYFKISEIYFFIGNDVKGKKIEKKALLLEKMKK